MSDLVSIVFPANNKKVSILGGDVELVCSECTKSFPEKKRFLCFSGENIFCIKCVSEFIKPESFKETV